MLKRKFLEMEESEIPLKRRLRPKLKLQDAPQVHSLKDLIELGKSITFYRNINTIMLWKITPYLEELNEMVGMESLKETIFFQVIYYLQGMHSKSNEEYLHTVIYGPPGSGKTTVAKIIGKIYQAMNILPSREGNSSQFRIAYRDDFLAGYLGQTAGKTKKLLQSCLGGVLFIDEVYALAPRSSDRDSFSKEAIDTINAFLSEHKNDFCCIVAGYEDEVQGCFFAMNKGLERRFPWVHRITEYSTKDLYNILIKMIRDSRWELAADEKTVIGLLEKHKKLFKNAGGDIETFLTKCKMFHSKRVFALNRELKFVLTEKDLTDALGFISKNVSKDDAPPESMYM